MGFYNIANWYYTYLSVPAKRKVTKSVEAILKKKGQLIIIFTLLYIYSIRVAPTIFL